MNKKLKLGFIGVGVFAMYTIRGLRFQGVDLQITISPRGKNNAKKIANECNCIIADNNQKVLDNSDIVFISVKPEDLENALKGLKFPLNQKLVSAVAGVSISQFEGIINQTNNEKVKIFRTLPVCSSEKGFGLVPVFPSDDEVVKLLKNLGCVFEMEKESDFNGATLAGCFNGILYELYFTMIKWFEDKGYNSDLAAAFVLENFIGTAKFSKHLVGNYSNDKLQKMTNEVAVEGTYTKIARDTFIKNNGLESWKQTLNALDNKFKGVAIDTAFQQYDCLNDLYKTICSRRGGDVDESWTAKLLSLGVNAIADKVLEEAKETVDEAISGDKEKLVNESADLLYHLLVLWADADVQPDDVYQVLKQREGVSGISEKSSRKRNL